MPDHMTPNYLAGVRRYKQVRRKVLLHNAKVDFAMLLVVRELASTPLPNSLAGPATTDARFTTGARFGNWRLRYVSCLCNPSPSRLLIESNSLHNHDLQKLRSFQVLLSRPQTCSEVESQ